MLRALSCLGIVGAALWLGGAAPGAHMVVCPPELALSETLQGAVPGLVPYINPGPSPPAGVALFACSPALGRQIAPEASSHPYFNNTGSDIWQFAQDRSDLWVACLYGQDTLMLAQSVPEQVSGCRATQGGGNLARVVCN